MHRSSAGGLDIDIKISSTAIPTTYSYVTYNPPSQKNSCSCLVDSNYPTVLAEGTKSKFPMHSFHKSSTATTAIFCYFYLRKLRATILPPLHRFYHQISLQCYYLQTHPSLHLGLQLQHYAYGSSAYTHRLSYRQRTTSNHYFISI